jgi:hypothetical protein
MRGQRAAIEEKTMPTNATTQQPGSPVATGRRALLLAGATGIALAEILTHPNLGLAKKNKHKKCNKRCKKGKKQCDKACNLLQTDVDLCKNECQIAKKQCKKTC